MSLNFTGWKDGVSYYKGLPMPEDKMWMVLREEAIRQIRGEA
jgi:hypothetical protein